MKSGAHLNPYGSKHLHLVVRKCPGLPMNENTGLGGQPRNPLPLSQPSSAVQKVLWKNKISPANRRTTATYPYR